MNDQNPRRWELANAVALCLASGQSPAEAAASTGVSLTTVYRWRRHPKIVAKVRELRDQMVSEALGRMAHNLTAAADTLVSLLGDDNPLVRLRAATALLEITPKLRADVDLASRLAEVERQLNDEQRIGA
jgi:HEAT repeat protein